MDIISKVFERINKLNEAKAEVDKNSSTSFASDGVLKSTMDYRSPSGWETDIARYCARRANIEYKTLSVKSRSGVITMTYDDENGNEQTFSVDPFGNTVSEDKMESDEIEQGSSDTEGDGMDSEDMSGDDIELASSGDENDANDSMVTALDNISYLDDGEIEDFLDDLDDDELSAFEDMYNEEFGMLDTLTEEEIQLNELSDTTIASYKKKAEDQIKSLTPWTKKGEYKDLAKNLIQKRQEGISKLEQASKSKDMKEIDKVIKDTVDLEKATTEYLKGFSEEVINEVLSKSDPKEKWIDDFVKSDNPKFKGKTTKERIKMALGAYYGAQNEENEENKLNEETQEIYRKLIIDALEIDLKSKTLKKDDSNDNTDDNKNEKDNEDNMEEEIFYNKERRKIIAKTILNKE